MGGAEVNAYEPMPNENFTPFVVLALMGALFLILSICFIGLGPVFYGHFFQLAGCCWIGLILWLLKAEDPKRFKKTPTQFVDIIHEDGEQYGPMKTLLYG